MEWCSKTCQGFLFGLVHIEDGVQLRELQQLCYLGSGIAKLQGTPRLSLIAFALRAGLPFSVVILEYRGAARRADGLIDSALRHDEFTETAAVDVGYIFEVEQNSVVALGNFIADRLPKYGERITRCDLARKIDDKDAVELSCG